MPEGTSNSLVNFGDISKPADTLIKKISKAVGGIFAPYQIKRLAKAEAEVEIIKAETGIHISDLNRRAMHRFIEEESQRQKNIEDITTKSLPQLVDRANPEGVEDDWITNFFDKARIVSDEEMQGLWSRVLAGEANAPGTFSKRTVNLLTDLDKTDAEMLVKLCGFAWNIGFVVPLVFDPQSEIYNRHGINFNALVHLESIGLIRFDNVAGFSIANPPSSFTIFYYGEPLQLQIPTTPLTPLVLGKVLFTKAGQELAPICGSEPIDGFREFVADQWK